MYTYTCILFLNAKIVSLKKKIMRTTKCGSIHFLKKYLFIHLAVLGLSCGVQDLSYGMWDLVPWPGMESQPPTIGAQSLSHWTMREVPWFHSWMLRCFPLHTSLNALPISVFLSGHLFLLLVLHPLRILAPACSSLYGLIGHIESNDKNTFN